MRFYSRGITGCPQLMNILSTLRAKPMFEKVCPCSRLESECKQHGSPCTVVDVFMCVMSQVCNVIIHSD